MIIGSGFLILDQKICDFYLNFQAKNETVTTVTATKAAQNCLTIVKAEILLIDKITVHNG